MIIAIDGHSGCGKSTTAKYVAAQLGYKHIHTGAMYRAVTFYFLQKRIDISNLEAVHEALMRINISFRYNDNARKSEIILNEINISDEISKLYIAEFVSNVSALPEVRYIITKQQREMGEMRSVVMEGRDIGTQVFPDAELKIFMTANSLVRAQRRQAELLSKGQCVALSKILNNIEKRDRDDTTRSVSPLFQADDAILLDTSHLTVNEQVEWILVKANERISSLNSNFVGFTSTYRL